MARYNFPPGETAESIANAISWIYKRPVDMSQVVVEPYGDMAGQFIVTVYETPDLAKKIVPFLDKNGTIPIDVGTLCPIGYKTDRSFHEFNPWQHGQIIGATESGKSSCLHVMLSHVTRCPECFIWVGGVWKLYDFVSSWLECYLNTGLKPPLERIAHGQEDVCKLIAAFLNISSYRLNLRNHQRVGLPYGILILDEVTYVANNRGVRVVYNGEDLNASQLIRANVCGTAGSKQYTWMTAQRDTMNNFGDDGGETTAQMGFSFIFYIKDSGSIGRITNDYGLDTPRSKGECWADFGMSGGIHKLRIPYAQSDDPLKPILHNGPKVSEIAWSRRHIKHEIDAGSLAAADEYFPNRFPFVTEEYLTYLTVKTPSVTSDSNGSVMPGMGAELLQLEQDFARMMAQEQASTNGNGERPSDVAEGSLQTETLERVGGVVDLSRYTTLGARVLAVCKAAGAPLSRKEIVDRLEAVGVSISDPQQVTNACGRHIRPTNGDQPRMGKTDDDKYYAL